MTISELSIKLLLFGTNTASKKANTFLTSSNRRTVVEQCLTFTSAPINNIIIHQTHYEKSDWSRAFNQFTIACELDMINAISAADIAYHVKFNVCLVTKPLGVFSSETKWMNASFLFLSMNYVKNV